jgi:hypothetical protein
MQCERYLYQEAFDVLGGLLDVYEAKAEFVGRACHSIVGVSGIDTRHSTVVVALPENGTDLLQIASYDGEIVLEDDSEEKWIFFEELIVRHFSSYRSSEGSQCVGVGGVRDRHCRYPF